MCFVGVNLGSSETEPFREVHALADVSLDRFSFSVTLLEELENNGIGRSKMSPNNTSKGHAANATCDAHRGGVRRALLIHAAYQVLGRPREDLSLPPRGGSRDT